MSDPFSSFTNPTTSTNADPQQMQAELSALLGMGGMTVPSTQESMHSDMSASMASANDMTADLSSILGGSMAPITSSTANTSNMAEDLSSILGGAVASSNTNMPGDLNAMASGNDMAADLSSILGGAMQQQFGSVPQQEGFAMPSASTPTTASSASAPDDDISASLASILGGAMGAAMTTSAPPPSIAEPSTQKSSIAPTQQQKTSIATPPPQMFVKPYIVNIVASVSCSCTVNLPKLAKKLSKAKPTYNPKTYAALILDIKDKKKSGVRSTAHVFPNGRVLLLGCTTEQDTRRDLKKVISLITKAVAKNAMASDYRIHNVIGKCNMGRRIHLERLSLKYTREAHYEPELFPGLVYRVQSPKAEVICFPSGEIIITGLDATQNVQEVFDKVYPNIQPFLIERTEGDNGR